MFSPLFSRILLSSAQCVMARVKKINVVIYDDLAPWKLFSDKFSPYPNSSMRRSLVIFLLGTDHRHYHQYTDNGSLHRVGNNVTTFILKEHLLFSFLTASLSSSDSRNSFRLFMYLFRDKFSLIIFLLGTDHRHYHQYTDNGYLHCVGNIYFEGAFIFLFFDCEPWIQQFKK